MMFPAVATVLICVVAYLLGSVPFGLLLGLLKGVDIREAGSGNIGATNLARTIGRKWGYLAFLLDFAKGCGPVLAVRAMVAAWPDRFLLTQQGWVLILVGLSAVLGHVFPVYLRFRGGKGVATAFGVMAALAWLSTLIAGVVWLVLYLLTRTVSVASLGAAIALPTTVAFVKDGDTDNYISVQALTVACALLIIGRHHENIARLLRGEEHSFRKSNQQKESDEEAADPSRVRGPKR